MALIHQWKFNGNFKDSIGNLEFFNSRNLASFTTGVVQKALNFKAGYHGPLGSNVYLASNPFPSLKNSSWTISFWVKNIYEDIFLYLTGNTGHKLSFVFSSIDDSFSILFNNGSYSGKALVKTGISSTISQFTHYTIVYTDDKTPLKLYINCVEQILFSDGSTPYPNLLDFAQPFSTENIVDPTNLLFISNNSSGYQLEDLRIYNEAINQEEINNICNSLCAEITEETQLVIATQPTGEYTNVSLNTSIVHIKNSSNTLVTSSNLQVTAEIYSGTGNLTGTLSVQAVNGVATFSDLKIDTAGEFTIRYTNPCLTSAISNNISLIYFISSLNSYVNLFIQNNENKNLNLYTLAYSEHVEIIPLFIKNEISNNFNLFMMVNPIVLSAKRLLIHGALFTNANLFTHGFTYNFKFLNSFLKAELQSNVNMFLYSSFGKSLSLSTRGGIESEVNLFLKQDPQISVPLYISTPIYPEFNSSSLLYMQGEEDFRLSYKGLNLFIENYFGQNTPLYMQVDSIGLYQQNIDLYIKALEIVNTNDSSIYLTLFNDIDGVTSFRELTITGTGIAENNIPFNTYVNMFMQRDYESFSEPIQFFIHGNTDNNSYINFNIIGADSFNNYVNMSIPSTKGIFDDSLDMFILAYRNWTSIVDSVNMFIESTTTTTTTLAP